MDRISASFDLLDAREMQAAEAHAFERGVLSYDLMQRAAAEVVAVIGRRYADAQKVHVMCGPGNNGGDGFVIARLLRSAGHAVTVSCLVNPAALSGDAARAAKEWDAKIVEPASLGDGPVDLIVDALFGIGLTRPISGHAADAVRRINDADKPVVAVDLPSGIDCDTGAVRGAAVRASDTVTFFRLKPGHVLEPGRSHSGDVHCADIGLDPKDGTGAPRTTMNAPALWEATWPSLPVSAHKYTRGHALVLAGEIEGTGAARLTARAALRVGAGLVTLGVPRAALLAHAGRPPDALMVRDAGNLTQMLDDKRRNVVAIGPAYGLGVSTMAAVEQVLSVGRAAVLDADALMTYTDEPDRLFETVRRSGAAVTMTPHAGEFVRLFGADSVTAGKLVAARTAARRAGATIVYKGPDTVIAAPDGRAAINTNGSNHLATAGTGDVLTGLIAGLVAQGMPMFEAAAAAVWLHAETGRRFGAGLIADDLIDRLPDVLRKIRSGHLVDHGQGCS